MEKRTEDPADVRVKERQSRGPDSDEEIYQAWRSQGRLMEELSLKEWVELVWKGVSSYRGKAHRQRRRQEKRIRNLKIRLPLYFRLGRKLKKSTVLPLLSKVLCFSHL